jgi:hypothetical protein
MLKMLNMDSINLLGKLCKYCATLMNWIFSKNFNCPKTTALVVLVVNCSVCVIVLLKSLYCAEKDV